MQGTSNVTPKRRTVGVDERHSRTCRSRSSGACNCKPGYRAWVYDRRSGGKIRKTFPTLAAAKAWRADATSQQNRGRQIAPTRLTLHEAVEAWLAGANTDPPTILTRSGAPYKPSVLREYERNLRSYVLPVLGARRLSDIRRADLQDLINRIIRSGRSPSTVRNVIVPIRVLFRHALERDEVGANPTNGIRLPSGGKPRDRAATADEAASLLAALPEQDRPLWATAFYAGLRRGELRALRWDDIDLTEGIIHVRRGWDDVVGEIEPKSEKGTRRVPITAPLRACLTDARASSGRDGSDLVFGSSADRPFTPSHIRKRAAQAWAAANALRRDQGLETLRPIVLHECRHTAVSLMADAGLSLERIGDYVGHSSAWMTDRYRHLLAGHEAEAARILDEYFARADTHEPERTNP
jgi:integrase